MKILKSLLAVGFVSLVYAQSAMAQPRAIVDTVFVADGTATVDVLVQYDGNADGTAAQFEVDFDETFLTWTGSTCPAAWACTKPATDTLRFVAPFTAAGGLPDFSSTVTFNLASAVAGTTYQLTVQNELYAILPGTTPTNPVNTVNGSITITEPDFNSSPVPGAGAEFDLTAQVSTTNPSALFTIFNDGPAGTLLDTTCTFDSNPSNRLSIGGSTTSNTIPDLAGGTNSGFTIACSTATVGVFDGAFTCTHNGDGTTLSTPQTYQVDCEITPGPQPAFNASPATLNFSAPFAGDPMTPQNTTISNSGDDTTTLSSTSACTIVGGDAGSYSLSTDGTYSLLKTGGTSATDIETVNCIATTEGTYNDASLSCPHNGSNTSPALIDLNCMVGPDREAAYTSAPVVGTELVFTPTEEADPDPQVTIDVSNTGDPLTNLTGTCSIVNNGDGVFSVSNGSLNVAEGAAAQTVTVTCDSANEGSYTSDVLSCSHNGDNIATPATYPLNCEITPPGAAIFDSEPVGPGGTLDITMGLDVVVGDSPAPTKVLTFYNRATDPNDNDLDIMCDWAAPGAPISASPAVFDTSIAPNGSADVTFTCSTASAGHFEQTYECEYFTEPQPGDPVPPLVVIGYTIACDVRDPESNVQTNPAPNATIERVAPPGGSNTFSVRFNETRDEDEDAFLDGCTLSNTDDFQFQSATVGPIPAGSFRDVVVEGTDPGGVDSVTSELWCEYFDSANSDGADVHYTLVLIIGDTAMFEVNKIFSDDNPMGVDVTISCNTGIPLEQTKTITKDNNVTFIVKEFDNQELDCEITEDVPPGYLPTYAGSIAPPAILDSDCNFEDVNRGAEATCNITNTLQQVEIEVTKIWIDDHPDFNNSTYAKARWYCDDIDILYRDIDDTEGSNGGCHGYDECGSLHFYGTPDKESFSIYPHYEGTYCHVSEKIYDSGVESDSSDCYDLVVYPGIGADCEIINTRFYEGIPTLSQYGLAILALLMLGIGMVGFRRFV